MLAHDVDVSKATYKTTKRLLGSKTGAMRNWYLRENVLVMSQSLIKHIESACVKFEVEEFLLI